EKEHPWKTGTSSDVTVSPVVKDLRIRYLANTLEDESRSLGVYLELPNQDREYVRDGVTYRFWRFRPGQQALLRIPVQAFPDVIVLPVGATIREAAEVYVFRQNGEGFERRPVTVLHEDSNSVVLANDGSINVGDYVAHNAAAPLNRALKAAAGGGEGGGEEG